MPVGIDDDLARQFADLGVTVAPDRPEDEREGFEVMADNWQSVCTFLACETQWRVVAGFAGLIWLGLDYTAVDMVMRRSGVPDPVFEDLQVMEAEALATFGEATS